MRCELRPRLSQSPISKVISNCDLANHLSLKHALRDITCSLSLLVDQCDTTEYIINPKKIRKKSIAEYTQSAVYIYIINLRMFCWYSQEENGDTSVGLDGWGYERFYLHGFDWSHAHENAVCWKGSLWMTLFAYLNNNICCVCSTTWQICFSSSTRSHIYYITFISPPSPPLLQTNSEKENNDDSNKDSICCIGSCNNSSKNNTSSYWYLHIVVSTGRFVLKVKWGEGECDVFAVWLDDVNTTQSVGVVVGEVGWLYGASQWRQSSTTRWDMITRLAQNDVIYQAIIISL